jgi:hypothetical protein
MLKDELNSLDPPQIRVEVCTLTGSLRPCGSSRCVRYSARRWHTLESHLLKICLNAMMVNKKIRF